MFLSAVVKIGKERHIVRNMDAATNLFVRKKVNAIGMNIQCDLGLIN
jgi:hypothetical protein